MLEAAGQDDTARDVSSDHLAKPILESLGDSYRLMILNDDSTVLNGFDLF